MGTRVREALPAGTLHAAVVRPDSPLLGTDPCFVALGPQAFNGADVVIDFSLPEVLDAALPWIAAPIVVGTTGLSSATEARLSRHAERHPVLRAANFSTGVTVLIALAEAAAAALPDYDVEIIEAHHRHKVDAPSGTALALGKAVERGRGKALTAVHGRSGRPGVRSPGELGYHALRGGEIIGEHDVWLVGPTERLRLGHAAQSRTAFAAGAVRAAEWLVTQPPGVFTLRDVLGLNGLGI